jgi:hypothetical protein
MTMLDSLEAVDAKVRGLLATNKTMFLSTSANDHPWVAGVFFAESDPFHLIVLLETTGKTLSNIRANSNVAVVISDGSAFTPFLQGDASALLLDSDDELEAAKRVLRAKAPEIEPLLQYPSVAVRLSVRRWRATDVMSGWIPGKELIPA